MSLEPIVPIIESKFGYSSYEEMTKSKEFKTVQQNLKDGLYKNKNNSVKSYWVKKLFSFPEWTNLHSHISYCFLRKEKDGIWAGFLVRNQIPQTCELCTDEEILQIDNYRRIINLQPFPCEEILKTEVQNNESIPQIKKPNLEEKSNPDFWDKHQEGDF